MGAVVCTQHDGSVSVGGIDVIEGCIVRWYTGGGDGAGGGVGVASSEWRANK